MTVEYTIFDVINGWAGHLLLLDTLGRLLAVFGLLAVLLLAIIPIWHANSADRRHYVTALLVSAAVFAALIGLELLLTHILGRELRSRPANARWTTMLITPKTAMAFPCWPVAISAAAGLLLWHRNRALGLTTMILTALQAVSFVFVGANYPYDVITGAVFGLALGYATAVIMRLSPGLRVWTLIPVGITLGGWLAFIAVTVRPASDFDTGMIPAGVGNMPATPLPVLTLSAGEILQLAENGHLTVGWLRIDMPGDAATLPAIESRVRAAVNRAFLTRSDLDVLTITVIGYYGRGSTTKMGTLYTATVDRADWPARGFRPTQKLPGEKYVLPRLLAHP